MLKIGRINRLLIQAVNAACGLFLAIVGSSNGFEMTINWINEITARGGYVATDELVKQMAVQHQITQAKCKELLQEFLSVAFSKGVGKERTSEIFLSRWERYRMPIYKDSYISHVYVR